MSKTWRLTPQAEQSMFEIAQWTFQTFGPRQADAYEQDILDRLDAIVVGIAHNRSCQSLLDKKLNVMFVIPTLDLTTSFMLNTTSTLSFWMYCTNVWICHVVLPI